MAEEAPPVVDLCFCLDCTGSMRPWMDGVKNEIQITTGTIASAHPDATINLGFVAYRDHGDGDKRIEKFDFNPNVGLFQQFVDKLKAAGGDDYPEDVLGGLWESANMPWSADTKVLFHIFDAPPHGRGVYHSCSGDLFPAGHPSDVPLPQIFLKLKEQGIDYYAMVQGKYPLDQMLRAFKEQGHSVEYDFEKCPQIRNVAKVMEHVGASVLKSMNGVRISSKSRPDDRRRDPIPHPVRFRSDFSVYCGIDFGTYGSAFATCTASDPVPRAGTNWGGRGVDVKTLTNVLLGKDKKIVDGPHGFGDAALDFYLELEPEEQQDYHLFRRFKMELYKTTVQSDDRKEVDIEKKIRDANGKLVRADTVLVEALRFIIDKVMDKVTEYREGIAKSDIQWILTVPAIWSQKSRRIMQKAAYNAGIPRDVKHDQLIVALEPECAAVAAQEELKLSEGDCYMMLDCGGGTVDIACHEMVTNTEVREIHKSTGGPWGATYVDDVFWDYLNHLFDPMVFEETLREEPATKEQIMYNFNGAKECASPFEPSRKVNVRVLKNALMKVYGNMGNAAAHLNEVKFPEDAEDCGAKLKEKTCQLVISRRMWDYFFDSVIDKMIDHIHRLLAIPKLRRCIQAMCVVGGFAASPILMERLRNEFGEEMRIVRPANPMLSVVTGAALFGLSPTTITERCAKYTIGIAVQDLWIETDGEDRKVEIPGDSTGYVVNNVFFPFVRAGQPIPRDERARVVHYFEPLNLSEFMIQIYKSDDPNPRFVPDKSCGMIGPVPFPPGFDHNTYDICVEFDFSDVCVRVRVWFGEEEVRPHVTINWDDES